jgi:hypothetical protein
MSNMFIPRQFDASAPVYPVGESHGSQILAITGFFTGLALLVVALRVYVRMGMLKIMGADDYVILISMVSPITSRFYSRKHDK